MRRPDAARSGRVLLNQWRFAWLPLAWPRPSGRSEFDRPERLFAHLATSPELDSFSAQAARAPAKAFPWARGPGVTAVHLSEDDGKSFSKTRLIDVRPFSGGYGMRGGVELANGDILLPLSDVPSYRQVFVVRSRDAGETWSAPKLAAAGEGHEFEEPATLVLSLGPDRDAAARQRNARAAQRRLRRRRRDLVKAAPDRRRRLSRRPAHPRRRTHRRGRRTAAAAVRRFFCIFPTTANAGGRPIALIDDLPNKDLGYPAMAQRENGDLFVVYYAQDRDGVTGIDSVTARLP